MWWYPSPLSGKDVAMARIIGETPPTPRRIATTLNRDKCLREDQNEEDVNGQGPIVVFVRGASAEGRSLKRANASRRLVRGQE